MKRFEGRALLDLFDINAASVEWEQGGWEFMLRDVAGAAGCLQMYRRQFTLHFRWGCTGLFRMEGRCMRVFC